MVDPITSGSKYGIDQPPCRKPPSVSSSAPPGACTTPSRLMNSLITIRMVDWTIAQIETHRRASRRGGTGYAHRARVHAGQTTVSHEEAPMATTKQVQAAKRNVKKAQ